MLCPTCGKESQNQRVCGHCQTPYPSDLIADAAAKKKGAALAIHLPPVARRAIIAALALFVVGYWWMGRERTVPVGVVVPNIIAAPMSEGEARALLKTVHATATAEARGAGLVLKCGGTLPEKREGLLAFAQQYARADEIANRTRRAISFVDAKGSEFAKADPATGVMLTR